MPVKHTTYLWGRAKEKLSLRYGRDFYFGPCPVFRHWRRQGHRSKLGTAVAIRIRDRKSEKFMSHSVAFLSWTPPFLVTWKNMVKLN